MQTDRQNKINKLEEIEEAIGYELPSAVRYACLTDTQVVHAAMLVNNRTGEILAHAINKRICSLDVKVTSRLSVHAEQELFYTLETKLAKNLLTTNQLRGKKTLISLRFDRNGNISHSKICSACAKIIEKKYSHFVNHVMYVDKNNKMSTISVAEMCEISTPSRGDKRIRNLV